MKRILSMVMCAGLGLAIVATPALAQGGLMVGGGLSLPQGDYKDAVKSGYHGMAGLNFGVLGAPLGVRVDAAYHLNDFALRENPAPPPAPLGVSGNAVSPSPWVGPKPYLLSG